MLFACVAGATTGATGLLFDSSTEQVVSVGKGLGLLPLEQDENSLYLRVQEICNSLASASTSSTKPSAFIFSLSSHVQPGTEDVLRAAIHHSRLRSSNSATLTWITRGEACWWASGTSHDAVMVKVGTVGFAHAFRRFFPADSASWRAGGWGLLSGDDGGAYYIGRQVLYRLFEEQDGRKERTRFSESFTEMMRERDTLAVTSWIRQHKDTYSLRLEVSRLAQAAIFLAEQHSDAFSLNLLRRAAAKIGRSTSATIAMARRNDSGYGIDGLNIFIQGRLVQFSPLYARLVCDAIQRGCTHLLRIQPLRYSPVLGCLQKGLVSNTGWSRADAARVATIAADTFLPLSVEFIPDVTKVFEAIA
jgi:hypothetical protein